MPEPTESALRKEAVDASATLFRPIGPSEKVLLIANRWTAWPPRLPEQPIFYPVTNEEYAVQIARDWEVPRRGEAWVTRFRVRREFIERYEIHQVGGRMHTEWWIPAAELQELNANLVGNIVVIRSFHRQPIARAHPSHPTYVAVEWLDPELPRLADAADGEFIDLFTEFPEEHEFGRNPWTVRLLPAEGSPTWDLDRVQMATIFDWRRLESGRQLELREGTRLRARVRIL